MSQSGLSGVTLGILADKTGMSKSGLFAHFKSKEEVQISLLEHTAQVAANHVIAISLMAAKRNAGMLSLRRFTAYSIACRAGYLLFF